jgi:hypothetical protein
VGGPSVTEKAFDEYHLYNISRKVDLLDRETKQIEFVRSMNVKANKFYVYDEIQKVIIIEFIVKVVSYRVKYNWK